MDVVCLGILVADVIARPLDEPAPGGSLALLDEITLHGGGCALNTASVLATLGAEAAVVGKVGADPFGDFLLGLLDARAVRREGVVRDARVPTSATVVLVDSVGERTFLHVPGANGALRVDELDEGVVYAGRSLHLAGALVMEGLDGEPFARVAEEARRRGIRTSLDPVWDPTGRWSRLEPCLPHLDLVTSSLVEGRALTGEKDPARVAAWLHDRGVPEVCLTMGAGGCYASGDGFAGRVAAPAVNVVDSTGAGDAFAAGLIHGRLSGRLLEEAARLGCAAGALATTAVGATEGVAGLDEVLALAGLDESG
ncbi:MAG: carbohydrate kinase family protein [Gaiellaceae bacterium]